MAKHTKLFTTLAFILIVLAAGVIFWLASKSSSQPEQNSNQGYSIGFGDDTVKARGLDVLEDGTT